MPHAQKDFRTVTWDWAVLRSAVLLHFKGGSLESIRLSQVATTTEVVPIRRVFPTLGNNVAMHTCSILTAQRESEYDNKHPHKTWQQKETATLWPLLRMTWQSGSSLNFVALDRVTDLHTYGLSVVVIAIRRCIPLYKTAACVVLIRVSNGCLLKNTY